jgi:predicted glutamate--cysteine ligase
LEEEVYTGTRDGTVVGLSHRIAADLDQFCTEPDARNVEFATSPSRSYRDVCRELMMLRRQLRAKLVELGDYTLIPGGTLSLSDDGQFVFSKAHEPYYRWIEQAYGTRVVTASTHINVGVEDREELMRVWRVIRAEAHLFLAITASSPFLNGEITGYHSTRWRRFPRTPERVPLFHNHATYAAWIDKQLADGTMQNIRHLWLSCRPNGHAAPHDLDRIELRICDRIAHPSLLLAVTALLEARVLSVLEDPSLDPVRGADDEAILATAAANEKAVCQRSLQAEVNPWRGGPPRETAEQVAALLEEVRPVMDRYDFDVCEGAIHAVLIDGNPAQQWLAQCREGATPQEVIARAIRDTEQEEESYLCGCETG